MRLRMAVGRAQPRRCHVLFDTADRRTLPIALRRHYAAELPRIAGQRNAVQLQRFYGVYCPGNLPGLGRWRAEVWRLQRQRLYTRDQRERDAQCLYCLGFGDAPKGVDAGAGAIQVYAECTGMDSTAGPVTITYHQVGACNGYNGPYGLVEAGSNFAYVDFGIESVDNTLGTSVFHFDPKNLYIQQKVSDFFDPGLAFYTDILGPFAAVPTSVAIGLDFKFSPSAQGSNRVSTKNANGAIEANDTS